MRFKKEKGFKKIQIVDSNYDNSEQIYESDGSNKLNIFIIIFIIFIIIIFIILGGIYYFSGNNRRIKYKKISDNLFGNQKRNNNTNYQNNENKNYNNYNNFINKEKEEATFNIEEILKNVDKTVKKNQLINQENIKISIIIMNNNKDNKDNLEHLYESIQSQSFPYKEIIMVTNDIVINPGNTTEKMEKEMTIVEYKKTTGKIMQRFDIVNMAKGEYILFIEGDDSFTKNDLFQKIYDKASQDNLDILEFKSYHNSPPKDRIIYQPEIFSLMYFGQDEFNRLNQFHLCGKLIKKEFFLNTFKEVKVSSFYFERNIQKFDQSMILLILFTKAKTFEVINIESTNKSCNKCERDRSIPEIKDAIDLLIYMRFLLEYSADHVPEKRMAANVLVNDFISKKINFNGKAELNLVKEVLDLYLNCDKIGEEDIRRIEEYQQSILTKLEGLK